MIINRIKTWLGSYNYPFLLFLGIIFFLPFERVPTWHYGGFDLKINVFLGLICFFVWLCLILANPSQWLIKPNYLSLPLLFLAVAMFLSLTQAGDLKRGVTVLVFIFFTVAFSVLTVNMLKKQEHLRLVIQILFWSSLAVALFGIFQFTGDLLGWPQTITLLKDGYTKAVFGFPRIQAFSMEPLYFANFLLIPIFLSMAYFFGKIKIFGKKWWLILILVLLLVNFILALARGAFVGFAFGLVIILFFMAKQIFNWKNVLALILISVVVFYGVSFALSKGDARATNEFIGHLLVKDFSTGESVQGRLSSFTLASQIFLRQPFLGIGIGNYGPYVSGFAALPPSGGWQIANNQYLEIFAETGLIGGLAFLVILIIIFLKSWSAIRLSQDEFLKKTMIGLLAAFVAVFIQYNFFSTLYIIHIWVLIGLMVGVRNLILKNESKGKV